MSLFDSASLVITPNGVKEGKLYSIKPTDGSGDLSVVRATSATRVDANGLVEIPRTNLILQSQTFENASWTKTRCSITSNSIISPDGTLTADTLVEDSTASSTHPTSQSVTVTASAQTFSIYAKSANRNWLQLQFLSTSNATAFFDLSNGVVGTVGSAATASIQSVGNGWYRCIITATTTAGSNTIGIYPASANGTNSYTGNGTASLYIWGAMVQQGNVATEYIPTVASIRTKFAGITQDGGSASNIPRLDYTNGSCPSILVEPQRTNLLLRSQEFDNASWIKTSTTITPNTTISPDGTLNADSMVVSSSDSRATQVLALGAGTYTTTVYVKILSQTTAGTMRLQANVDSTNVSVNFTPTTEWQRVTATYNATVGIINFSVRGLGFIGTIAIWGSQLEAGSNATSYIPTVASSVTRNADVISKTGISSLIGQTEGTIFTEFNFTNVGTEKYILNLKDAASSNVISFRRLTSGEIRFVLTATTSSGTTNQSTAVLPNGNYKIAYKYISGSIKIFINGSLSFTLNPTFTFGTPISIIELGNQNAGNQINDSIKQLQLYKTALTDTECIQLTTL
jgi:hypothetical protein